MKTFSVAEAAKELGVSAGTVYALCAGRRLRHERIGLGRGTIRIPADALDEYRRSVTVGTDRAVSMPPSARVKLKHLALLCRVRLRLIVALGRVLRRFQLSRSRFPGLVGGVESKRVADRTPAMG
jgi:excisionase family DNA binding protein